MNKKTLRIAEELVKTAEDLIFADSDYIYDPDHKKHPGGGYHKISPRGGGRKCPDCCIDGSARIHIRPDD
mgnify:CR=1 FL=1